MGNDVSTTLPASPAKEHPECLISRQGVEYVIAETKEVMGPYNNNAEGRELIERGSAESETIGDSCVVAELGYAAFHV